MNQPNNVGVYTEPTGDRELDAIKLCQAAMFLLTPYQQLRILAYLENQAGEALLNEQGSQSAEAPDAKPADGNDVS